MTRQAKSTMREARRVRTREHNSGAAFTEVKLPHARASVNDPSTRRSDHGLCLGSAPIRRRLGWHRADHLVLVLDLLQHRNLLIGAPAFGRPATRGGRT